MILNGAVRLPAFVGIAVKHAGTPAVATAAWVVTAVVVLVVGVVLRVRQRQGAGEGGV